MNNQENKNKKQETGKGQAPQNSFWKKTFAKRWTFPVIYLAASVLIVGLMYAKSQDASPYKIDNTNDSGSQAGPVTPIDDSMPAAEETNSTPKFIWPVGQGGEDALVSMDFYRDNASEDARAAAVVMYDNKFTPHQGVDIGLKSDKPFNVVAAAQGTVLAVEEDPLMGQVVTIDHGNGYSTYYASLQNVTVEKGAKVMMGQPIAQTGNSKYELDAQNHIHFEMRKDGQAVDPLTVLEKKPGMMSEAVQPPAGDATATAGDAPKEDAAKDEASKDDNATTNEPAEKSGDDAAKDSNTKPQEKKEESSSTSNEPQSVTP
ncbi:MAG TPA: M23 family metallopeptidase [Bacilli bacterium]|nr:M23 family metallopeptidase [Bacilli bacterium]